MRKTNLRHWLASGVAAGVLSLSAGAQAQAEQATFTFDQPAMPMPAALQSIGRETGMNILVDSSLVRNVRANGLKGELSADEALYALLDGTGLTLRKTAENSVMIVRADQGPQGGSAAGDGAEVEALIVTAQKREEDIQDVPIAISAFTQEALEAQKIEGGFDLLKAIPNVTFSKTNFTSYNFSIRGIGTKAISATTDPGVAVSFNNIALLQNRLFEQEYFDVERVEVLRGPQGTLYGRNATSGVINIISAKPDLNEFDGWVKGEVGNYDSKRASAMINIPVIEDRLAMRLAGAFTDRQGYDFNEGTGNAINGRDLWSARLTLGFNPTETIRANLIWERFEEDDNRSRTGKQLCHRDSGPAVIGDTPVVSPGGPAATAHKQAFFSQGCKPGSLYDDAAFSTPNGLALPFVWGMIALNEFPWAMNADPNGLLNQVDPYGGRMQSRDLRVIDSIKDPTYRAKADLVQLNLDWDISDHLTLSSQTAWNNDNTYSAQDYNRFNTDPIINDTSNFMGIGVPNPTAFQDLAPGGFFNDPQLGSSNKLVGYDIAMAQGEQFAQELRLQSDYDGPLNFSLGANYTRFKTLVDYYVFYNLLTATALIMPFNLPEYVDGATSTNGLCYAPLFLGFEPPVNPGVPRGTPGTGCPYIDPNPLDSINGEGHNYFRSKNPYRLKSWAAFGELYWDVTPDVKLTAGLRYTDDHKTFIPVPTQVLLSEGLLAGGTVNRGYPEDPPIEQKWGEWTGRVGVDWKPDLGITDDTMLYAFYSRGYKAGGANPPEPGFTKKSLNQLASEFLGFPVDAGPFYDDPILYLTQKDYESTFKPEFVNAFEVGAKNTLLGGSLQFNTTAFFYDYTDYQVSQIKNRTAVNENFDAQAWGLEFETLFSPSRNFQLVANLGYLNTKIADGESSIDIMNRTQGNPNLVVAKPWIQLPSNCVVPLHIAEWWAASPFFSLSKSTAPCGGTASLVNNIVAGPIPDTFLGGNYDPRNYDGTNGTININGGAGIRADLGGNELPNAPHWTANIGAQYGWDILEDWRVTVRGDAYWQSQSWARVYNVDGGIDNFGNEYGAYDKLHGWYNLNLSVWFEKPDADLKIELYAKNVLDKTPITDAFLNSDDTALTTNVFVLDPRLIGLSIKKGF